VRPATLAEGVCGKGKDDPSTCGFLLIFVSFSY
jgi:hypothetical protein